MTQPIAMLIEASGIQNYIFGSNELIQHIGASELVTQATTDWLFDEHNGLLPQPHNVQRAQRGAAARWQINDQSLADGLAAEVVYAGGGNALILFASDVVAQEVACRLTKKVLQDAPGLRLVLARQPFAFGQLAATVNGLRDRIARQKRAPERSVPLLGLGVTAACDFTGAPAVGIDKNGRYISAEVAAKQRMGAPDGAGNNRLLEYLSDIQLLDFGFIYDFDQLGTPGESSYLAVVHTDGNRMGERIQAYVDQFSGDDRAYIKAQRQFSQGVQKAAHAALVSTVGLLLAPENLQWDGQERCYKIGGKVPVSVDDGQERLPFRPIVFGGDDVTFVCEGRLGLPLAAYYLARLSEEILPDGDPLYARAGIAIVKTHYPFAQAYALAEELCTSAKNFIRETDRAKRRVTALDWHFAVTGLVQPLKQIRQREYTVADGSLIMRPLCLAPADPNEWRSWDVFSEIVEAFVSPLGLWAGRRNKLKALREALRAGPQAVSIFLQNLADTPQLPQPRATVSAGDAARTGWQGNWCFYFDAIEAADFYVPLKGV